MKKVLRKLIILLLIVSIFFLIKDNTTRFGTTPQTWDVQSGMVTTWIDLTNCSAYFDGCNTCSVKDGKADACTLMYCETPSEPKCLVYATGTEVSNGNTTLANPASVNCQERWWTLEILEWTGGQYGMCTLSDGTKCEERAFFRGECGTGTTK